MGRREKDKYINYRNDLARAGIASFIDSKGNTWTSCTECKKSGKCLTEESPSTAGCMEGSPEDDVKAKIAR